MIKSFAARAIIPVALTITGFVVLGCAVLYSFVRADFVSEARLHQREVAETVLSSMRHSMMTGDRDNLTRMIADIGQRPGVVHLRIFSPERGTFTFSAAQSEVGAPVDRVREGCTQCHPGGGAADPNTSTEQMCNYRDQQGRPILAMMVPILNSPECSTAPCHAHAPGEAVLGGLDIGLSQERLDATLAALLLQMAVFCLMVLILSVGGVSALLWRNVFLPMKELVEFSESVTRGRGGPVLAKDEGEIEMVIRNIKEMADSCHEAQAHADGLAQAGRDARGGGKKAGEKPGP